ncbi:MAG: hypothetical protein JWQ97_2297 [Phenylobacterium sp.]|nr:hypothetical protein [Phenylobacterium sp.]
MTPQRRQDLTLALEVLSVTAGAIMEDLSVVAAQPPDNDDYASLAQRLQEGGEEIIGLACAMRSVAALRG